MKNCVVLILCCLALACRSGRKELVRNQSTGGVFGTSFSIIYLSDESVDYQVEIDSVFRVVNQSLSTYIPESDISRVNLGDSTLQVDHMFKEVFEMSRNMYRKTNGYFDPTVGTLVNAWGFGPGKKLALDSVKVDSLLHFVGFDKVGITQQNTIVKENVNIYFDFNAIAKGYAIDRVAVLMDNKGIQNYLIEIGGEIVAKGRNRIKDKPWTLGIDNPDREDQRELKRIITLNDRALASSGNYRKFRLDKQTGEKYVHTIDPTTGFTRNSSTLGVTVLANTCALADGYATAFMAMELAAAKKIIESEPDLDAYIIYADVDGSVKEYMTDGFKEVVLE